MSWTASSKSQSPIRYLIMGVFLLCTTAGAVASAKCMPNQKRLAEQCNDSAFFDKNVPECNNAFNACAGSESSDLNATGLARCEALKSRINEASSKYSEKCAKAGVSQSCESRVKKCDGIDEKRMSTELLSTVAESFGKSIYNSSGTQCSSVTGREYKDAKKDIQTKLKDANKDLADVDKKRTELTEDYNKAVAEIEEKLAEEQKKYSESQVENGKKGREVKSQVEQTLLQARATRRQKEAAKVKLSGELSAMMQEKNDKLSNLLDSDIIATCFEKASAITSKKTNHSNSEALFAANNSKKLAQQTAYSSCKRQLQAQRLAVIRQYENAIAQKQKEIQDNQSEVDDLDQQVASAQTEFELQQKDQAANATNALGALNKTIELANKKRTALDLNVADKKKNLDKAEALAKQEATTASNEMMQLGPAPAKSSGDVSVGDAYEAYSQLENARLDYENYRYMGVKEKAGKVESTADKILEELSCPEVDKKGSYVKPSSGSGGTRGHR